MGDEAMGVEGLVAVGDCRGGGLAGPALVVPAAAGVKYKLEVAL